MSAVVHIYMYTPTARESNVQEKCQVLEQNTVMFSLVLTEFNLQS